MNKSLIYIILLFIILIIVIALINVTTNNKSGLKMYFFNAGKADSCIITYENNTIIIDTGEKSLYKYMENYLKNNNIKKIDYLIITHFDKDHLGSASNILNNFEVEHIIQSNYPKDSKTYDNYINVIKKKKISPITCRVPMTFNLNELSISIIPPALEEYETKPSNNSSLITSITFKDTNYLFTGDIENDRIKEFVASNKTFYDFLKVPYHGHYQDNLKDLLDNVKAKYFVITSSDEEKEDDETINLINSSNIYLTRKGNIILNSDGTSIDIRYE